MAVVAHTTQQDPYAAPDVRALRLAAGLTVKQVAIRARCSIASVANFDAGYRPQTMSPVFRRVVRVLTEQQDAA